MGLRMGAFLFKPDILHLGEDMCQHFAQIVLCLGEDILRLSKGLRCGKGSFTLANPRVHVCHSFLLFRSEGSPSQMRAEASLLQTSASQQRSFLFVLANCFAIVKVFLCLGEAVPQSQVMPYCLLALSLLDLLQMLAKLTQMRD